MLLMTNRCCTIQAYRTYATLLHKEVLASPHRVISQISRSHERSKSSRIRNWTNMTRLKCWLPHDGNLLKLDSLLRVTWLPIKNDRVDWDVLDFRAYWQNEDELDREMVSVQIPWNGMGHSLRCPRDRSDAARHSLFLLILAKINISLWSDSENQEPQQSHVMPWDKISMKVNGSSQFCLLHW